MRNPLFLSAAADTDVSLFEEIWYHFSDNYLNNDAYYEHLNMGRTEFVSLRMILLGLCLGIAVAAFAAAFNKRILGGFVRALLREDCLSAERAKTLAELGFVSKIMIRLAVRKSVNLRRVVRCREEEDYLSEVAAKQAAYEAEHQTDRKAKPFRATPFRANPDTDHYYIPEELKYTADAKFEAKGTTWGGAVIVTVLMTVVFAVAMIALPYLLELINGFVGSFKA